MISVRSVYKFFRLMGRRVYILLLSVVTLGFSLIYCFVNVRNPKRVVYYTNPFFEDNNMESAKISILTANVGNLNWRCRKYLNNLCYKDVEERISTRLNELRPHLIAFQEVLAPWQCKQFPSDDPRLVCFTPQDTAQVRRLLGEEYTIVCDSRNQFTCIALHISVGRILDCPPGELCHNARTNPFLDGCDNGFTVSAVTVQLKNGFTFDVANVHLQSTSAICRARMLDSLFAAEKATNSLIKSDRVLVMGDFNFDPWRDAPHRQDLKAWQFWFDEKKMQYHSGIIEADPPYYTSFLLCKGKTVDIIASNFAEGRTVVLGESPQTFRLDGGAGMDHRAVYGWLLIPLHVQKEGNVK